MKPEKKLIGPAPMGNNPLMDWGVFPHRDERWRYIRYADGSEELYDPQNDPQEWTNLAGQT